MNVARNFSVGGFVCAIACVLLLPCCRHAAVGDATATSRASIEDSAYSQYKQIETFYNHNQHDSIEANIATVLDYCRKNEQWTWYYKSYSLLVNSYFGQGDYETAIAKAHALYDDATRRNDTYGQVHAFINLGNAYNYQEMWYEAMRNYSHALRLYPADANKSDLTPLYSGYCDALAKLGNWAKVDSVLTCWREFLSENPAIPGNEDCEVKANWHTYYQLTAYQYHVAVEDYDSATEALDSALYFAHLEGDEPLTMANIFAAYTHLYEQLGDYTTMLAYCDSVALYASGSDHISANKNRQSRAYAALGRYEEAYRALLQYSANIDSITNDDNRTELNLLNKRLEVSQLRSIRTQEQMESRHQRVVLSLALGFIVILALTTIIYLRHRAELRLVGSYDELESAYSRLEVANARAEESSRMKTKFIQQISHEIRTPLNILSGFTQVITTPGLELDEAEMRDINQGIVENTKRITGLVSKMLELADANSKTVLERNDKTSPLQIAAEAAEASGISAAEHLAFDLDIDSAAEDITLTTNAQAATRALTLVLDNARKFTQQAEAAKANAMKSASADGQPTQKKHAILRVNVADGFVRFVVEDDGIGIPSAEAEHIFEEFVQLDDYYDGTGIGLTVARSLARRLGGDIVLDTTYTPGARFVVTLPMGE